jgi:glycosyltransferase involved in cell wall biosynthesis
MNLERDLVSIGLPAFKSLYFEKALKSILNQSYTKIEVIIVNDASPDDFDSILGRYTDDKRIRYYKNRVNLGAASLVSNWNKCVALAKGEFFVLASDDDIYHEDFLSEMLKLANKHPEVDLFHTRIALIDKDDKIFDLSPLCPEHESCFDFVWHRIRNYRSQYAPDFMCRTEALRSIGGFVDFPSAWCSDDATWFMLSKPYGVAYSHRILFHFRYSGINITSGGHVEDKIKANYLFKNWLFNFLNNISEPPISIESLHNQIKTIIEQRNSILLSSESYWKLLMMTFHKQNSIGHRTVIQAVGRKIFSRKTNYS